MGRVQVLEKHIAELIAAGEVVERPSSIVKELVENSIDAGAHAVTVEIKAGGVSYIRITDDGEGIAHEDVPTAFLRHATSKIRSGADLDSISTLGFRGEALASIAAVSRVELITRTPSEELGTHYIIEGGDQKEYDECGCACGTTMIIRDIFFNTPARMKFLKKDVAEGNAIAALLDRMALSHPEISLRFIREGKQTLLTSGDGKLKSAIYAVYGREFTNGLMPVEYELNNVRISGFISRPTQARPNTTMQTFFINGRYCRSRTMQMALEEAYKGAIMIGKHPACVLGVHIDCSAVDVNVHPAKMEVRFTNEKPVYEAVYFGVRSSLNKNDERSRMELPELPQQDPRKKTFEQLAARPPQPMEQTRIDQMPAQPQTAASVDIKKPAPEVTETPAPVIAETPAPQPAAEEISGKRRETPNVMRDDGAYSAYGAYRPAEKPPVPAAFSAPQQPVAAAPAEEIISDDGPVTAPSGFAAEAVTEEQTEPEPSAVIPAAEPPKPFDIPNYRIIGEAFRTYILLESEDKIILIDKHAAHERLIYERLRSSGSGREPQMLLMPLSITLDKLEYANVLDNRDLLMEAGFEVDDFGTGTIIVRSAPAILAETDITEAVLEIAGQLGSRQNALMTERLDNMYHTMACRAAIKGHDDNKTEELAALVMELLANPDVRYCPHGRPIYVELTRREMEKSFGRIQS